MDSTVKEGRLQGGKEGKARKASLGEVEKKHEQVRERKISSRESAKFWFYSKSDQT